MGKLVQVRVNGTTIQVPAGTVASAAVALAGKVGARRSVRGQWRAPLCGMGICHECRLKIDGTPHQRGCLRLCVEDMEIVTDD